MKEKCEKCSHFAAWEVKIVHPGPVMPRVRTYFACDNCKDVVSAIHNGLFQLTKL